MGTPTGRDRKAGDLTTLECRRLELQAHIDAVKDTESRRKLGQFATPGGLAREIVENALLIQSAPHLTFLEPSLGTGAFYSALLSGADAAERHIDGAFGIEIDPEFSRCAQELWSARGLEVIQDDFTRLERDNIHANLLISNPPYVRHHYISKENKAYLARRVFKETGLRLSGLSGLYCYFMLLAHKYLEPGAVSAWLVPSEFMDVNYGSTLKDYLLNRVRLLRLHRYDPRDCQFSDALVSSCVVWFQNEAPAVNRCVRFSFGGTHQNPKMMEEVPVSALKTERKWTRFPHFCTANAISSDLLRPQLGDYFTIKRGLVTGDNSFFIMTRPQIEAHQLEMSYFLPVLPSPRKLKVNEVFSDIDGFPKLENQYFLLNPDMHEREIAENHSKLWRYLKTGEKTTALKYICRNRKIWYQQERREPTPFLCSYMGRGRDGNPLPFRFILNHSNAVVTNTYLMLYPKKELARLIAVSPQAAEQIWSSLNAITADDLQAEGRVYGGGLRKIEPNELARVRCDALAETLRKLGWRVEPRMKKKSRQLKFAF